MDSDSSPATTSLDPVIAGRALRNTDRVRFATVLQSPHCIAYDQPGVVGVDALRKGNDRTSGIRPRFSSNHWDSAFLVMFVYNTYLQIRDLSDKTNALLLGTPVRADYLCESPLFQRQPLSHAFVIPVVGYRGRSGLRDRSPFRGPDSRVQILRRHHSEETDYRHRSIRVSGSRCGFRARELFRPSGNHSTSNARVQAYHLYRVWKSHW